MEGECHLRMRKGGRVNLRSLLPTADDAGGETQRCSATTPCSQGLQESAVTCMVSDINS